MSHHHTPCGIRKLSLHIIVLFSLGIGSMFLGGCVSLPPEEKAIAQINRTEDPEELYAYAMDKQFSRVRKLAAERLRILEYPQTSKRYRKQQECFEMLVRESTDKEVRRSAIMGIATTLLRLGDEDALASYTMQHGMADLLCHPINANVRQKAMEQLIDPMALVHLVCTTQDKKMREYGVRRIDDDDNLYEIMRKVNDPDTTRIAVAKIKDQAVLTVIIKNTALREVDRVTAVKKIESGKVLRELEKDGSDKVRTAARERLAFLLQR